MIPFEYSRSTGVFGGLGEGNSSANRMEPPGEFQNKRLYADIWEAGFFLPEAFAPPTENLRETG